MTLWLKNVTSLTRGAKWPFRCLEDRHVFFRINSEHNISSFKEAIHLPAWHSWSTTSQRQQKMGQMERSSCQLMLGSSIKELRWDNEILFQISFGYNVKEVLGEKLKEDLFVAKSVGSILSQIIWLSVLPSLAIRYHLVLGNMLSLTPDRLSALLSTRCPGGQSTASFISSGYSVSLILNVKQN